MAHHKSALKRIRQTEKRNERNRALRARLRTEIKKFQSFLEENKDPNQLKEACTGIQKTLDKAATKGIIHRKNAARKKSRLMKAVNKQTATLQAAE